jgi:TRAP-type C4-dicarboxylate transport system substrate-binding protein
MPIGFQIALNAYAINLDSWNKFSPEQQAKLADAFKSLEKDIWAYSEELFDDAVRCNVGKEPCTTVKKYSMTEVPVADADLKLVQNAIETVSFPAWSGVCNQSFPECGDLWKKMVGPVIGLK